MLVKNIMKTKITSLAPETNAYEALKLILKKRISGLPVIDNEGRLCGMFTEKEILNSILPAYLEKVGAMIYMGDNKIVKKMQELKELCVKDIMRKEVVTVTPDVPLAEVARRMLTEKIRRIPVIQNEKVVGIIAREDVVIYFAGNAGINL